MPVMPGCSMTGTNAAAAAVAAAAAYEVCIYYVTIGGVALEGPRHCLQKNVFC